MERNNLPISILQSFQSLSLSATTIDFGREFARNKTPEEIASAINQFLQLHTSNKVEKFHLYFCLSKKFLPDIENWVAYAVNKGVEEVHLDFSLEFGDWKEESIDEVKSFHLPASLFKCETLTNLSTSHCNFSPPPDFAGFGCLQSISLKFVNITGDIFQQLIANCPLLENLSIVISTSLYTIKLSSDRLRKLTVVNPQDAYDIEISAPRLESFKYYGVHIFGDSYFHHSDSFINISSLSDAFIVAEESSEPEHDFIKMVYDLRHVKVLTVCRYTVWRVTIYNDDEKLPILLPNLKELQLIMGTMSRWDLACTYNFFRLCPSPFLEKLFIKVYPGDVAETCYDEEEAEDTSDVNFSHLKVIKVSNFKGRESEMRLVGFLLQKAVILESMVLVGPPKSAKQNMDIEPSNSVPETALCDMVSLHVQLSLLTKASPRARVVLCEHSEDDMSLTPTHTEYFEDLV